MRTRRQFVLTSFALAGAAWTTAVRAAAKDASMYGLIGRMTAQPGQRDALAAVLLEGLHDMPGCLSYVVANDPESPDALWITEVWTDAAAHTASLQLPSVKAAIAKGRPLIAGFGPSHVTQPIGGHGLR